MLCRTSHAVFVMYSLQVTGIITDSDSCQLAGDRLQAQGWSTQAVS